MNFPKPLRHAPRWLPATLFFLFLAILLFSVPIPKVIPLRSRLWAVKTYADSLAGALQAYDSEYNTLPSGSPKEIASALRGENSRKIVFFDVPPDRLNTRGEFIDIWDYPYCFDLSRRHAPRVWSCGPNHLDESGSENSDDITSWR